LLIPVDARDWDARMPIDAPPIGRTLIERLKKGRKLATVVRNEVRRRSV
jgi:hypothetical protein